MQDQTERTLIALSVSEELLRTRVWRISFYQHQSAEIATPKPCKRRCTECDVLAAFCRVASSRSGVYVPERHGESRLWHVKLDFPNFKKSCRHSPPLATFEGSASKDQILKMSALQKQLAVLRANVNELDLRSQKVAYSKSLLFDPRTAGSQSLDVVYQICYEGFEDLCTLDSRFIRFQRSLFSPSSRSQDRGHLTEVENKELDNVLETFLGLVGGRLLLKPAQKATEWLIRRFRYVISVISQLLQQLNSECSFRVHELNTECLVLTFLPYHATPLFLALLSILPSTLSPTLKFLMRYTNSLQNPPKHELVQAAIKNMAFLSALNQYVLKVSRKGFQHHMLISLWTSLVVQSVAGTLLVAKSGKGSVQIQKEEDLLLRIFALLKDAMSVKGVPELYLGCYMIIAVLVSKSELPDDVLVTLLKTVAGSLNKDTCAAGISCLALISEQTDAASLPRSVSRAIMKQEGLEDLLVTISRQQDIRTLATGLAWAVATAYGSDRTLEHIKLVTKILSNRLLLDTDEQSVLLTLYKSLHDMRVAAGPLQGDVAELDHLLDSYMTGLTSNITTENHLIKEDRHQSVDLDIADEHEVRGGVNIRDLEKVTGSLQGLPPSSFLAENSDETFFEVLAAFESALPSQEGIKILFRSHVFGKAPEPKRLIILSFLVRVWCTSRSAISRQLAMEAATHRMSLQDDQDFTDTWLLPYILVALADPSRNVRVAAAKMSSALALASTATVSRTPDRNKPPPSNPDIYGTQSGKFSSGHVRDFGAILNECVNPRLTECVSDASYIATLLRTIFSTSRDEGGQKSNTLKPAQRIRIFTSLCSHAICVDSLAVKVSLTELLNSVDKICGQPRAKFLSELIQDFESKSRQKTTGLSQDPIFARRFQNAILDIVHPGDEESVKSLIRMATEEMATGRMGLHDAASSRLLSLWPSIHRGSQKTFALSLLHKATAPNSVARDCERCVALLRSLKLDSDIVKLFIEDSLAEAQEQDSKPVKRSKIWSAGTTAHSHGPVDDFLLSKLTLVLEIAESSKLEPSADVFHVLCLALQQIQRISLTQDAGLDYLTNLSLSLMASTIQAFSNGDQINKLDPSIVRADTLVECACKTSSPQARSSALLLLSALAQRNPQIVLHSVMPIFTMISSTTARQSDDFSSHVVDQTIQDVIPMLAQKLREEQKDLVSSTAEILLSFAAAFEHIPPHRRLHLFGLLASSLGPEKSLFAIMAALVDQFPDNMDVVRFISTLFTLFDSFVSIKTVIEYVKLIEDGFSQKPNLFSILCKQQGPSGFPGDLTLLRHLKMISILVQDSNFKVFVRRDLRDHTASESFQVLFTNAFEVMIKLSQCSSVLRQESMQILKELLTVLPFEEMIVALNRLLDHHDQELCKAVLRTLESRIVSLGHTSKQSKRAVASLLERLASDLESPNKSSLAPNIISCVDCICEKFGKLDSTLIFRIMKVVSGPHCLGADMIPVRTLSLHCLASSIEILGPEFIPLLRSSEEAAITSLSESLMGTETNPALHNAAYTYFVSLAEHIPFIISKGTSCTVMELSAKSASVNIHGDAATLRTEYLKLAATKLDFPLLFHSLSQALDSCISCGPLVTACVTRNCT